MDIRRNRGKRLSSVHCLGVFVAATHTRPRAAAQCADQVLLLLPGAAATAACSVENALWRMSDGSQLRANPALARSRGPRRARRGRSSFATGTPFGPNASEPGGGTSQLFLKTIDGCHTQVEKFFLFFLDGCHTRAMLGLHTERHAPPLLTLVAVFASSRSLSLPTTQTQLGLLLGHCPRRGRTTYVGTWY